ncbi:MAG TPA: C-terminal binding protein [Candidatus Binatia bacterium]|nr:C-terminal binding protein [Candidatus Binatia bacterium]
MPLIASPDASPETVGLLKSWALPAGVTLAVETGTVDNDALLIERCRDADAILLNWAKVTRPVIEACPKLKIVSFLGIGVDGFVDFAAAKERGIRVANVPGYGDRTVAEHAIALMFAVARRLVQFDGIVRGGGWAEHPSGLELKGRRIGLVGFGPIARETARMALGLGLEVVAWTRTAGRYRRNFSTVKFIDLAELFATSDIVSLHLSLNDATRGLIDAVLLSTLKPHAILINTARGGLMDYDCLEKLLAENKIFGAGLDVFPTEPFPDRPLKHLPNVVLTPHIGFNSTAALERLVRIGLDNLLHFLAGKPQNLVV